MLWIFYPQAEFFDYDRYRRYAPDLVRDRFYQWLNRYFLFLQIPLGLILYAWVVGLLYFGGCLFALFSSGIVPGLSTLSPTSGAIVP